MSPIVRPFQTKIVFIILPMYCSSFANCQLGFSICFTLHFFQNNCSYLFCFQSLASFCVVLIIIIIINKIHTVAKIEMNSFTRYVDVGAAVFVGTVQLLRWWIVMKYWFVDSRVACQLISQLDRDQVDKCLLSSWMDMKTISQLYSDTWLSHRHVFRQLCSKCKNVSSNNVM